jgi:hypothetical protein
MEVEMRKIYAVFAGSLAVMGSVLISGVAGGKTTSGSSLNATITVYDTDATGARTHIGSDDYNGSGSAVYSNVQDNSLVTYVFNGTLFLNLYSQSRRTLYINADDPVPGSPSGPAPGQYWQDVEFYISCYDATGTQVPLQNITASSGNCRVGVDFYSAGEKYKLDMGPVQPATGPATGWAYVQCNSVSGGQCVNWTVTPNIISGAPNPTVANLYYYARGGKLTYLHQYYDTYRIGFTKP